MAWIVIKWWQSADKALAWFFFYINPLQPNIRAYILHTALCTFPRVLTRRICLTIKSLFSWWSFPFSRDLNAIFMVVLFSLCFCFFCGCICLFLFCFVFYFSNRITLNLRVDRPSWAKQWNSVVVLLIFSSKHRECLYLLKGTETFSSPFFYSIILKTDGEAPAMLICITNIYCLFQLWKDVLAF